MDRFIADQVIIAALKEDMPTGDLTSDTVIPENAVSKAVIAAKEPGVLAGIAVAARVFELLGAGVEFQANLSDGSAFAKGDVIAELSGSTRTILKGERVALNFLQRLSGIATATRLFCDKVEGISVNITDTRKTTPGMRYLEKYAVRMGGGKNHRFSLSDAVLIKDNHIVACGGIIPAVKAARQKAPHTASIEVETQALDQVKEALEAGADIIMLDNMDIAAMKKAVDLIGKKAVTEASGGITLDNVRDVAKTGVDVISIGAITHSSKAVDFSMKFV